MEAWTSNVIEFNPSIIDDSRRIIEGVASAPVYDRANELITADALKKAVPDYMVLPIVTVHHKEFIAGKVEKLWFDEDDRMNVRVRVKPTRDVDKVWELIKAGVLNAFSIAGSRIKSTCSREGTPCVTDEITLNSITICGSDKCNQEAYFEIAKSLGLGNDTMSEPNPDFESMKAEIVDEVFTKTLAKMEEEKQEDKSSDDEMEKAVSTITELVSSQKEAIDALTKSLEDLSARLEKIENIPFEKSLAFANVDGTIIAVSADDFKKTIYGQGIENVAEPAPFDIRSARKLAFKMD